jgi:hypothetical protein
MVPDTFSVPLTPFLSRDLAFMVSLYHGMGKAKFLAFSDIGSDLNMQRLL